VWTAPVTLGALLLLDYGLMRRGWRGWRRGGFLAALIALSAALLLLAQGFLNAFDSDLMYRVAAGLAEYGAPTKYPGTASWTKYGFGQPLLALPFYELGKALLLFGGDREALTRFTVSLTN